MLYQEIIDKLEDSKTKTLDLRGKNIGEEGAKYLAQALKSSQIIELNLSDNKIGCNGIKHLLHMLKSNKITKLNLSKNNLGDEGIKYLFEALADSRSDLYLVENEIEIGAAEDSAKTNFKSLAESQKRILMTELDLSVNNIGCKGIKDLSQVLKNTDITKFNLNYNNIGCDGLKHLSQVLKNTQITELDLAENNIGNEGVRYLTEVLVNTKINRLDLSKNIIEISAAADLNKVLNNTEITNLGIDIFRAEDGNIIKIMSLRSYSKDVPLRQSAFVELHHSKIGIEGARYINKSFRSTGIYYLQLITLNEDNAPELTEAFKGIKINNLQLTSDHIRSTNCVQNLIKVFKDSKIFKLSLTKEDIEPREAKYLAEFLREVKILDLDLGNNYIGDLGMQYLAPALIKSDLMYIDFSSNCIKSEGARFLSEVLQNSKILFINFCNNSIGVDGAKHLANGLPYSQVTSIHLHGNSIKNEGYKFLADAINDTNITWVNLNRNDIDEDENERVSMYYIPRNTTPIASKLRNVFKEIVSLNSTRNEFEFIVPRKNIYSIITIDEYAFLIRTLRDNQISKVHIFDMVCNEGHHYYDFDKMSKIHEFITMIVKKFNTFIENKLPDLVQRFSNNSYNNYVNLVNQFEESKMYEIVQNLLLHRVLYYVDDNQEILHPYIYKMLNKYSLPLYSKELQPNKREEIISYYQEHQQEIDGAQEIIDLLRSELN